MSESLDRQAQTTAQQQAKWLLAKADYYRMEDPPLADALVCTDEELIAALEAGAAALRLQVSAEPQDGWADTLAEAIHAALAHGDETRLGSIRQDLAAIVNLYARVTRLRGEQ